jgi:transposase-like protein
MKLTSTALNKAEKLTAALGGQVYQCPSCRSNLTVESQVVRERGSYYIIERLLKCRKCNVRIRQTIYVSRINL